MNDITKSLDEATEGFKKMQMALLIFAGLAGVAIILVSIALIKRT